MPSKSPEQARLMAAVAHGWHKPGGNGPPVSVAKEFNQADKGTGIMKGYMGKQASYAEGGAVLGRTKDFLKTPDRFRDSQFKQKTEDVFGKNDGDSDDMSSSKGVPTAPKDKCLTPVKPRS